MSKKMYSTIAGVLFASMFFGNSVLADTNDNMSKFDLPDKEDSIAFTLADDSTSEKAKKEEKLTEGFTTFGALPADIDEVLDKENLTGVNPLFFPSTDLSKIVKDWKVIGKQYVREEADLTSDVLLVLEEGDEIEVLEQDADSWYKIKIVKEIEVEHKDREKKAEKEIIGYISSEYIQLLEENQEQEVQKKVEEKISNIEEELVNEIEEEIKKEEEERKRKEEEERKRKEEEERKRQEELRRQEQERKAKAAQQKKQQQSSNQNPAPSAKSGDILSTASKYLGAKYLYGASPSRTDAFDCSSFTQRVFREAGVANLPRTSAAQSGVGTTVSRSNLQPGDLVFFNTSGKGVSHVGIYAGNGKFIGAQTSTGVSYADLNSSYWSGKYVTAKRVR